MSQPKNAEDRLIQKIYSYPGTGNNTQFAYDPMDRCVQIQESGSTPSYSGNATKNFVWCGSERCEERDSSNAVVSRFCGLGQATSGSNYFYAFDHLGSVREVTDSSGNVLAAFGFDPYGNRSVLSGTFKPAFGFTGIYQHSRTNLALTWFRQYNPSLGRWLSRDPIGMRGGSNLYAYVGMNPISLTDRSGLMAWIIPVIIEILEGGATIVEASTVVEATGLATTSTAVATSSTTAVAATGTTTVAATGTTVAQAGVWGSIAAGFTGLAAGINSFGLGRGRAGNEFTRQQETEIAKELTDAGWKVTNGADVDKQYYIQGACGGVKGSVSPDIRAVKGNRILNIEVVSIGSNGRPTQREIDKFNRGKKLRPNEIWMMVPKGWMQK